MQAQRLFWEIQQNFNHIRLLCVKKYSGIDENSKYRKVVLEDIFRYCLAFFECSKQLYEKELLQEKFQLIEKDDFIKEKEFAQKKENLTEAFREGYGCFSDFMTETIDYPLLEKRAIFGLRQKGENPYQFLQNIGKKGNIKKITLAEIAQIFQDVLKELSGIASLDGIKKVSDKIKLKSE